MLTTLATYSRMIVRRNDKTVAGRKSKLPPKSTDKTIPVFQYATSDSKNRRVYVWGLAEHGALGTLGRTRRADGVSYIAKPSRLYFGEHHRVTDVACGYGFTLFGVRSDDGKILYGNGINTDSQLGTDDGDERYPDDLIPIPRPINLPLASPSPRVLGLAAGRAHSLVLTNEGLFALGNNAYGQCGGPIIQEENYRRSRVVRRIPDIKGERITGICAGQDHSIILTENGKIYTFGWGADGQTALAHYRNESHPTLVKGDLAGQNIVKVACVADCVLALSDKGKVFGWGNSEYGQLPAKGDDRQINVATQLEISQDIGRVTDIAAGGSFCMLLNDAGNVYVWGYGILGLGPAVTRIDRPTLVPPALFGANAYEKNVQVTKIYCGISHLGAVTNAGDLYTWGRNKFGSLGLGHTDDQYFPLKVSIGAQVKKVSCGVDHTVTLCKPFI